jgi:histidinol-phosphate phosphatase family domain/HAD-superfamily hydrolase, subfamily IIIA
MASDLRGAVFFDRDGTLMREEHYCDHPSRVQAIPGTAEALAALRARGWLLVMVTNQSGIGRGYFTHADYEAVNAELFRQLGTSLDGVYCCADHPDTPTPRRKPGTGMVEEAVRDFRIDPTRSWMIGDKDIDIACGRAAGCRTILVRTGYGEKHRGCGADHIARDVAEAVRIILEADETTPPAA